MDKAEAKIQAEMVELRKPLAQRLAEKDHVHGSGGSVGGKIRLFEPTPLDWYRLGRGT